MFKDKREEGDLVKRVQEDAVKTFISFGCSFFCSCPRHQMCMAGSDVAPDLPPLQYLHQMTRIASNSAFREIRGGKKKSIFTLFKVIKRVLKRVKVLSGAYIGAV